MIDTDELHKRVVQNTLSDADLWGQLAEEAAELSQAALKMQRLLLGTNPPRKTEKECIASVVEEHADLALCFELLDWHDKEDRKRIREEKLRRWAGEIVNRPRCMK